MIYAVIDTNVLVSALITHNPEAATAQVVRLMLERAYIPMYDEDIIAEYEDVLHRAKFPIIPETADALIAHILGNGMEASRINYEEAMPDEDDRVFLEVALSKEDSFLVTGNQKHYPSSARVITPAQFLEIYQQRDY
ncbi:MAG: putative toxin-antitoxin system toxin component, PIN family [Bacteroidaceae bacterium]|nr:putative toxin-antitoxin system toxin component, PIN family [Bacteroidaceae bacterium]